MNNKEEKCGTCGQGGLCELLGRNNKPVQVASEWITCDTCNQWYHGTWQDLQPKEVTTITRLASKGVRWHCTHCLEIVKSSTDKTEVPSLILNGKSAKQIDNIERIVKTIAENHNSSLDQVKSEWSDMLKKNMEGINKNAHFAQQAKNLMEKSHQLREEENRKNNAIVTGIQEQEGKTAIDQIKELMKLECFARNNAPLQAVRLGKKIDDGQQKRPIKVRFEDENTKWEFIKRFNNKALREQSIYCKLDESQEVRNQQFLLRQEVKKLKAKN